MKKVFIVDVLRCIACGKCEIACAFAHGNIIGPATSRINVVRIGPEAGIPIVCLQCHEAACVKACPVSALLRNEKTGAIEVVVDRCIKCRHCVQACPFGCVVWDHKYNAVQKCDLCQGEPQCVPFCPTGALSYAWIERVAWTEEATGTAQP